MSKVLPYLGLAMAPVPAAATAAAAAPVVATVNKIKEQDEEKKRAEEAARRAEELAFGQRRDAKENLQRTLTQTALSGRRMSNPAQTQAPAGANRVGVTNPFRQYSGKTLIGA